MTDHPIKLVDMSERCFCPRCHYSWDGDPYKCPVCCNTDITLCHITEKEASSYLDYISKEQRRGCSIKMCGLCVHYQHGRNVTGRPETCGITGIWTHPAETVTCVNYREKEQQVLPVEVLA